MSLVLSICAPAADLWTGSTRIAETRPTCIYYVTKHHHPGYPHHTAFWIIGHVARHQGMAQISCIDRQCGVHRQVKLHPQPHNTNGAADDEIILPLALVYTAFDTDCERPKHKASFEMSSADASNHYS